MAGLFRRPTRLLTVVALITVLYILVIFIPKPREDLYGFQYFRSSYDWSNYTERNPVAKLTPLPRGSPKKLPKFQHNFASDKAPSRERLDLLESRRTEVRDAFVKSWNSYKKHAWMYDELTPVSGRGKDTFGGWAATLVDSLDTLWIMELRDEFRHAAAAAVTLDWAKTRDSSCNVFETTIRHLGGLLSAYDLSKEAALLQKAIELGDMLYAAFDTDNRMPPFYLDFDLAKEGAMAPGVHDPSAAVTSSGLEFTRLAQLTGQDKYYDAIDRVARVLDKTQNTTRLPGMWPTFLNMRNLDFSGQRGFTLGAMADSLYEYFPKMYAITGGLEPMYEKLYRDSMDAVIKHLLFRPMTPDEDDILFTGSVYVSSQNGPELDAEGQHLGCFAGGMFGLGGKLFNIPEHLKIAEKIARGCAWAYNAFPIGIMPEAFSLYSCTNMESCPWDEVYWQGTGDKRLPKGFKNMIEPKYILRPEAIESLFFMYRMTGNPEYQEMAWGMFQSIKKATETRLAFSAISDVTVAKAGQTDKQDSMESFWTSETLKYFYLIFSPPDLVDLDKYVLNTEAHPFLRPVEHGFFTYT
ncbi:glycosyl hydrolase family 47 [Apiospora marii]|uniref:alpha-1,2-Mannosidase n=1 Tax=Apiospora marii TaxID=335849 RepID=A0ABR1REE1_9PEZI